MPADSPPEPPSFVARADGPAFDLAQTLKSDEAMDLRALRPRCQSTSETGGEILVCAPDPESERIRPLAGAEDYAAKAGLPQARWSIAEGVDLDIHTDAATMGNGVVSNRLMVGIKLGF